MYVCLCKGLTEAEVVERTRSCIADGVRCPGGVIEALELECEDACGFCAENPEHIVAIFEDELETHLGYSTPCHEAVHKT